MAVGQQAKNAVLIRKPCFDQIALMLPHVHMREFVTAVCELVVPQGGEIFAAQSSAPEPEITHLLALRGWQWAKQPNGDLVITDYTGQMLDLEQDPVLNGACGIVAPGSFLLVHASYEFGPMWWVSYTEQEKEVHRGCPTRWLIDVLMACSQSLSPISEHAESLHTVRRYLDNLETVIYVAEDYHNFEEYTDYSPDEAAHILLYQFELIRLPPAEFEHVFHGYECLQDFSWRQIERAKELFYRDLAYSVAFPVGKPTGGHYE